VIQIPEIPYDVSIISKVILKRSRSGTNFSIVAVAEGAINKEDLKYEKENMYRSTILGSTVPEKLVPAWAINSSYK